LSTSFLSKNGFTFSLFGCLFPNPDPKVNFEFIETNYFKGIFLKKNIYFKINPLKNDINPLKKYYFFVLTIKNKG